VDGVLLQRVEIFKHDSWAATGLYEGGERRIVCKFNRLQPILFFPTGWAGRWLASREESFLRQLARVQGIPRCYAVHSRDGAILAHAVAHDFIPGRPLSVTTTLAEGFFARLELLLAELHARRIAYVDLHKQENIIVGEDGNPHLIDFQISLKIPHLALYDPLWKLLVASDRYHLAKHRRRWGVENWFAVPIDAPWWIRWHRRLSVPVRRWRRSFLVWLGIRRGDGAAVTEASPEIGLRRAA
jgi:hypothetical protein